MIVRRTAGISHEQPPAPPSALATAYGNLNRGELGDQPIAVDLG